MRVPVCWSSVGGFVGVLMWMPEDLNVVPPECVCGARLHISEIASIDDSPIELTCSRGHRWRDTFRLVEERLTALKKGAPR